MLVDPEEKLHIGIENYASLNNVALRRILADPNASTNAVLYQAYVTVLHHFDPKSQSTSIPENLLNPPRVTNEPGPSRIWNDFTFQEIGKGDNFLNIQSVVDKETANPEALDVGIAPPHPFLSPEKATQVNKWRTNMGTPEPSTELSDNLRTVPGSETEMPPPPAVRKAPGIKKRRPAPQQQPKLDAPTKANATVPEVTKPAAPNTEKELPRRKWMMNYQPSSNEPASPSEQTVKHPVAKNGSRMSAYASAVRSKTLEEKPWAPVKFDASKYGLNDNLKRTPKKLGNGTTTQKPDPPSKVPPKDNGASQDVLVDVFAPETDAQTNSQPLISFNQPALVPQNVVSANSLVDVGDLSMQQSPMSPPSKNLSSATGESLLDNESAMGPSDAPMARPITGLDSFHESQGRLESLKSSLQKEHESVRDARRFRFKNPQYIDERLAKLERDSKKEEKQAEDEVSSREFYHTMHHKARKSEKAKQTKAKRQATLEDAWGLAPKATKPANITPSSKENEKRVVQEKSNEPRWQQQQQRQQQQAEINKTNEQITSVFAALQPTLDAAEFFPGTLTLESQIGLILIPLLPKTYSEGRLLSANEWNRIFQPRHGLPIPTTKFISRLTSSGADVDYIVGLKRSKEEGKTPLFEQDYTDYSVFYEYHCRTNTDAILVITVDENGKFTLRKPTRTLGTVNLHFPRQTWDASMVINGINKHVAGSDKEIEEAVQYLVDNIWVQPDRNLIRIFTRLPEGNKLVIEKVFMKRWTRHRYIRPDDTNTKDADSKPGGGRSSMAAEKAETNSSGEQGSVTTDSESGTQDLFLQVTEVQDLILGISPSDTQAVRASCAYLPEMIRKGRLWHEVSVVSPAIEAILKANSNLEVGECTEDWTSTDLLGKDAYLVRSENSDAVESSSSASTPVSQPLRRVESAIGPAGLGEMFRLTRTIVERIDGVGYHNVGPGIEAARAAVASGTVVGGAQNAPSSALTALAKLEPKNDDSDDSESAKGTGVQNQLVPLNLDTESARDAMEQEELDYW